MLEAWSRISHLYWPFCLPLQCVPPQTLSRCAPLTPPSLFLASTPHPPTPLLAQQSNDPTAQNSLVGGAAPRIGKEQRNHAASEAVSFLQRELGAFLQECVIDLISLADFLNRFTETMTKNQNLPINTTI